MVVWLDLGTGGPSVTHPTVERLMGEATARPGRPVPTMRPWCSDSVTALAAPALLHAAVLSIAATIG